MNKNIGRNRTKINANDLVKLGYLFFVFFWGVDPVLNVKSGWGRIWFPKEQIDKDNFVPI